MRTVFLFCLLVLGSVEPLFAQANLVGKKFQADLKSVVYGNQRESVERELSKEVVVVRFINPENVRIDFELEIWQSFIQAVDTSLVGFVFYSTGDPANFRQLWNNSLNSSVPLIIDSQKTIGHLNKLPENPSFHTLILSKDRKVLFQGGSPIINDTFNDFRDSIARELQSQGYDRGVKGVIIDRSKNHMQWFMGSAVYLLPDGQVIPQEEAMKRVFNGNMYPQYSLSDTVRLVKRN